MHIVMTSGAALDWVGILRELRFLATELQTDRFYALYFLGAICLLVWLHRWWRSTNHD